MKLSREKLVHLSHVIVAGLEAEPSVKLLRDAEGWRLAHPIHIQATKRTRWWIRLIPWRRGPVTPPRLMTIKRTSPGTDLPGRFLTQRGGR